MMQKELTRSRFTPSLLTHKALEAIFVRRERLAERLVESIKESATTGNKHFFLLHGPRGIGKTHMVSLVHGRVTEDTALTERLCIAWLREEEWGVASYVDLLRSILRALYEAYNDKALEQADLALPKRSIEEAEAEAERLLLEFIGERTLLILTENVDEIFAGLEEVGQKKLRALLQNHPVFCIVATARGLFSGVELRESPFYGFFNIHALDELTSEDATRLLAKIAHQEDDSDLEVMLGEQQGHARIRALHFLAGGNPRVYVIFSQFLTCESLDSLVSAVMNTLDDLTCYYQERMARLSSQQRKITQFLCDQRGASTVKVIAESNFITQQSASSQLKKLRELGYVRSEQLGRESYYELKEPLMRITLGVKKHRGEPLSLLVEFLRLWYTHEELEQRLASMKPGELECAYLSKAIELKGQEEKDPVNAVYMKAYVTHIAKEEYEAALGVVDKLIARRKNPGDWDRRAECLWKQGRHDEALMACDKAIEMEPDNAALWNNRGLTLKSLGDYTEALSAHDSSLEIDPYNAYCWNARCIVLIELNRYDEALNSSDRAIEINPNYDKNWIVRGLVLETLGRYEEALNAYDKALRINPDDVLPWYCRGDMLTVLGRYVEAMSAYDSALEIDADDVDILNHRGVVLEFLGRYTEALHDYEKALEIDSELAVSWRNRATVLSVLGRQEEALEAFNTSFKLETKAKDFHGLSNHAVIMMLLGQWEEGLGALDTALDKLLEQNSLDPFADFQMVRTMLVRTRDTETWRKHIAVWVDKFKSHGVLSSLGQGLVQSIRTLSISWIDRQAAQAWYAVWQELAGAHKEMGLPLRLLKTAVDYQEGQDERVLFQLPIEERKLLEPLLGIRH